MAILNVPSAYATPTLANAAAIAGDTILIEPGTYLETVKIDFIPNITIAGNTTDASTVVLSNNTDSTVDMSNGGSRFFSNLTIANGILPAGGGTQACLNGSNAAEVFATNVIFASAGGVTCVQQTDKGGIFNRCKFTIPFTSNTTNLDGFRSLSSNECTLTACVFIGWTGMAINAPESTVINCSVYEAQTGTAVPTYGIWTGNIHNCAIWTPNVTSYGGRSQYAGYSAGFSSAYAPVAAASVYVSNGAVSDGDLIITAAIVANGNNLYVLPPTNMEPNALGLAFQNGNSAYALPPTDYAGNAWNNPPSRGAYEQAPTPTPTPQGSGKASINNLVNLNNLNNLS